MQQRFLSSLIPGILILLFLFNPGPNSFANNNSRLEELFQAAQQNREAIQSGTFVFDLVESWYPDDSAPEKVRSSCVFWFQKKEGQLLWRLRKDRRVYFFDGKQYWSAERLPDGINYAYAAEDNISNRIDIFFLENALSNGGPPEPFMGDESFHLYKNQTQFKIDESNENIIEVTFFKDECLAYKFQLDKRYDRKGVLFETFRPLWGQKYSDEDITDFQSGGSAKSPSGKKFMVATYPSNIATFSDYKEFRGIWYPSHIVSKHYRMIPGNGPVVRPKNLEDIPKPQTRLASEKEIIIEQCVLNNKLSDSLFMRGSSSE